MDKKQILSCVDHTLLTPCATWEEIQVLCEQAIQYQTASVCIPPSYVRRVAEKYGSELVVCTVIGFPLGYSANAVKKAEIEQAVAEGADELDVVVDLGDVKDGAFAKITDDLRILKKAAGDRILKVIVETCYLTKAEKIALCACVTDSGADYIKTSTGFGSGGAVLEDIILFKAHIGPHVKIKASGGIRTEEDFKTYLDAGCSRIGTSSAIKVFG